jgi:hypothetical protein
MNMDELERLLPEEPSADLREWVFDNYTYSELGGECVVFHRKSMYQTDPWIERGMLWEPKEQTEMPKRVWGAWCTCTACTEDFIAGWHSECGVKNIVLTEGDDGCEYSGIPDPEDRERHMVISEGKRFICPCCNADVELVHKSNLKTGRTYQLLACSVEIVGQYMALIYWMAYRQLTEDGYWIESLKPTTAVVLIGKRAFKFTHKEKWRQSCTGSDPFQQKYHNYESWGNKKVGGVVYPKVPDLAGTSGEKTGIREYILSGGNWPYCYLRFWQEHPAIENLMKAGWCHAIDSYWDEQISSALQYGHKNSLIDVEFIDWSEVKPHRMLGMSREDAKHGREWSWNWEMLHSWADYCCWCGDCSAAEFDQAKKIMGKDNLMIIVGDLVTGEDWNSVTVTAKYLQKQMILSDGRVDMGNGVQLLHDYREMIDIGPGAEQEVLWPRDLLAAHERAAAAYRAKSDEKTQSQFDMLTEKYAALTWNDGELCIRIAARNSELEDEGRILRHCVGSYGEQHCKESDVIFFVRKYRRPERSYYTLDMRLNGEKPAQVQLHGYGNERHGVNKEHRHTIPQKVLDFVERWKTEILLPWWQEQKRAEARAKAIKERKTA